YRFVFEVDDRTNAGNYVVEIDNIRMRASSDPAHWETENKVDIVNTAEDLDLALVGGGRELELSPVGDDELSGGAGDDIIFGDVINTDNLPWGVDGNPAKPEGEFPAGSGLSAL